MQTCVLLSIKPQFVQSIFEGEKQYEFRRRVFKSPNVKRVVIYASAPISKVVGEFEIDGIIESELSDLWENTNKNSGIHKTYFESYFHGLNKGYAIRIGQVKQYDQPLELQADLNIDRAPQFFMYLNDLPENLVNNLPQEEIAVDIDY